MSATWLSQFWQRVEKINGRRLADYNALHQWSLLNPEKFWQEVHDFCGILSEGTTTPALIPAQRFQDAIWFPDLKLNYAENLLRDADERTAVVEISENGHRRVFSRADLLAAAGKVAALLTQMGVQPGDQVAGWLPNRAETIIAMLGTSWIGAIWSSCSPDFGVSGVMDRFGQIEPRVLLVTDAYDYNGKMIPLRDKVAQVCKQLSPELLVQIPYGEEATLPGAVRWDDWLDSAGPAPAFRRMDFDHPLFVLYSSGTTGAPKCIVHGTGGTLLQHAKEHWLHTDIHADDCFFYFTTCGWMMWNWLAGGLQTGATLVLYDGNPAFPDAARLFDLVDQENITHFGTSAKFVQAVEKAGVTPRHSHRLNTLRVLMSTGSPLLHESFDFLYQQVKPDMLVASISGGTDILSCFALGNPLLPVHRGELQCAGLGMDVAVFDDQGQPLENTKGELVCRAPFPSRPVAFWNDPDGSRYEKAYFRRFPGIWAQGDYAEIRRHDHHFGVIIHGRSDAVLNPGGVRIGTAEIYRQVETLEEIRESIVVGQDWEGDVRVVLFVVMQPGQILDDDLRQRIRQTIRAGATPRHVPAKIVEVPEIPRTVSGKIVELAVREVIHARPVTNKSALANPQALTHFENRPELRE